jgi:acyl dehydratase
LLQEPVPQVTCIDDVVIGQELPPLVRGPLSPMHLMRFSAAIENWHRIHYDHAFATGHDGLPDLVVSGSWKQHFVAQMVRRWAGDTGWMREIGLQYRKVNVVGETLTAWGRVAGLEVGEDVGLVTLDVGIVNQDGIESSPGRSVVLIPLVADVAVSVRTTESADRT